MAARLQSSAFAPKVTHRAAPVWRCRARYRSDTGPAAKYNEHLQLEGWKLDKPVQFKNNSNQLVYKVIEFGTFDKKPKWVKHGTQEWQEGTYTELQEV